MATDPVFISKEGSIQPVAITATFGTSAIGDGSVSGNVRINGASNALNSIDWGTKLSDNNVTVYFGEAGFTADGYTSEGFNAYEIAQFQAAFDQIASMTGLTFTIVTSAASADLQLVLDVNEVKYEADPFLGYFNPPGTFNAGVGVFNGDAWDRTPGGDLEIGGFGYVTIMHELLHGLGLAHPHDRGGTSLLMTGVSGAFGDSGTYGLNQGLYTTMTYNSGYLDGPVGTPGNGGYGFEFGPMALDLAVLQDKYGANTTTNGGNNTYYLPDANALGTYWQLIWDTGGVDTIRYEGARAATIDLRAATLNDEIGGGGWVSAANGVAGGYTIANGVVVENAIGGQGNDKITGNAADNLLLGRDGNDAITGGDGNDRLVGGNGTDSLSGGTGDDVLNGGDGNDTLNAGGGSDRLNGANGDDRLNGGAGDDLIAGAAGADTLAGAAGNDRLNGGAGDDLLSGGDGDDAIYGASGADRLRGNNGADRLYGGDGDDLIHGQAGDDLLSGAAGNDRLVGGDGSDILVGGGGRDRLIGGSGTDVLTGSGGVDVFVFSAAAQEDRVTDFEVGIDRIYVDQSYWTGISSTADFVAAYASVTAEGVVFDFGNGDILVLEGLTSTAGLEADLIYAGA